MVKFRGINVSIVSQHDARKVPEYEPPASDDPFRIDGARIRGGSISTCYVPSYPGSQVWFDYSVDNPHPPHAQYFFKLLRNGEVFTTWDCTAKYDYQGRTMYALKFLGDHPQTGEPVIRRQAFRFSTELPTEVGPFDDCIEIRVHRIEYRMRAPLNIADIGPHEAVVGKNVYHDGLRMVNGGVLAPDDPKRHYKYQLIDPVDKPYARIRFYYRPAELLKKIGAIAPRMSHARHTSSLSETSGSSTISTSLVRTTSKASSSRSPARSDDSRATGSSRAGIAPTDSVPNWLRHHRLQKYTAVLGSLNFDTLVTLLDEDLARLGVAATGARNKLLREISVYNKQHLDQVDGADQQCVSGTSSISSSPPFQVVSHRSPTNSIESLRAEYVGYFVGDLDDETPPDLITKNNDVESALPIPSNATLSAPPHKTIFMVDESPVQTSSETRQSAPADKICFTAYECQPPSPTKSPKKNLKSLKVKISGTDFELQKEDKKKRPLSPFTPGGKLRRLLSPTPPSAPARITAFGPTIDDEVREGLSGGFTKGRKNKYPLKRTTQGERAGGALISRLLNMGVDRD